MGLCLYIHSKIYIPQPDTLSTVNTRPVWYLHCNCFHLHKFSFYTITPHPNTGMHQDSRVSKYYKVDYFRQFFNAPQFRSACNFCGTEREREREKLNTATYWSSSSDTFQGSNLQDIPQIPSLILHQA